MCCEGTIKHAPHPETSLLKGDQAQGAGGVRSCLDNAQGGEQWLQDSSEAQPWDALGRLKGVKGNKCPGLVSICHVIVSRAEEKKNLHEAMICHDSISYHFLDQVTLCPFHILSYYT